jgi:hypothetical protein
MQEVYDTSGHVRTLPLFLLTASLIWTKGTEDIFPLFLFTDHIQTNLQSDSGILAENNCGSSYLIWVVYRRLNGQVLDYVGQ